MPLLNGKEFELAPVPSEQVIKNQNINVFYIPFTGEIFVHYDDYYARMMLYRTRSWNCQHTGKRNLTYQEALESEKRALTKKVESEGKMPTVWIHPALELIHHSRLPLNELIDTIYDYFRGTRFVDETVFVDVPTHGNERSVERATIIEKLDNTVSLTLEKKIGDKRQMQREAREAKEDLSRVPDDPHHYRIQLVNNPSRQYVCLPSQMRRGRQALSKQTFKKFIKEVATKEKWIGSPWQVKANLVLQYNLPTDPPPDLGIPKYKDDAEPKRRKNADLYECPIEDIELLTTPTYVRPVDPEDPIPEFRPVPCYDFGTISEKNVFSLIKVYNYLYINGTPLRLYPFIFDDFLKALNCQNPKSNCVLICEVFGSLLKYACPEFQSKFEHSTGFNPYYKPLPQKLENGTWSVIEEESKAIESIIHGYTNLSYSETIAVDQWFKWRPGQWGEPPKKKKSKTANSTFFNSLQNLKAWQVALYGLIRDWYDVSGDDKTGKWKILAKLIAPIDKPEMNGQEDVEMESVVESTVVEESNRTSAEPIDEKKDIVNEIFGSNDELEKDFSEDELEYSPPPSTKKKRKIQDFSESEEDQLEWSDEEAIHKLPSRKSSTRTSLPATPAKKPTPPKPKPKAKKPTPKKKAADNGMDFAGICERMEINFWTLTADERIEILLFLVEECVQEVEVIRKFQDDSIERTTELKKEERDIARQRKQLANQIAALDKASGTITHETLIMEIEASNAANESDSDGEFSENKSRRTRLANAKRIQQELAKKKLEQGEVPLQETEEQRKIREEKQALEDQDRALERRLNVLEYLVRTSQSICRIKPLGRDRYCNKFWWFDGALGALSFETVAKIRDVPEQLDPFVPNNFAFGVLFVEEFSNFNGPFPDAVHQPNSDLRQGMVDGKWGYYSKSEQIKELMKWLDLRGIRESNLHRNLDHQLEFINDNMERCSKQREEEMEEAREARETQDALYVEPFLEYCNHWY